MSLDNYSDLKSELAAWDARDDLTDKIPDFIKLAEGLIDRKLSHFRGESTSTATLSSGSRTVANPAGVEIVVLEIKGSGESDSEYEVVDYVAPDLMAEKRRNSQSEPRYYTIQGATLEFDCEANQDYTLRFQLLDRWDLATDSTNWLFNNYPDVYLSGSLYYLNMYNKDSESAAMWMSAFIKACAEVTREGTRNTDDEEMSVLELSNITGGGYRILTDDY